MYQLPGKNSISEIVEKVQGTRREEGGTQKQP